MTSPTSYRFAPLPFTLTNTSVGTTLEDVGDPIVLGDACTDLRFELVNDGTPALADFALLTRAHPNGAWITEISGATWGTVAGTLKKFVGALNTLASAATGAAYVDVGPVNAIKFQAKAAGSTVLANGTFTGNANSWTLGAGWAYGANAVTATTADTTLKQEKANMGTPWTNGGLYEVTFTLSSVTAGSLTVGTNTDTDQGATYTADGAYTATVTADNHADGLVFTGTGFSGTIDGVSAIRKASCVVRGQMFR